MDGQLADALLMGAVKLCVHGDSNYNAWEHLKITFQGSTLTAEISYNNVITEARSTVEWMFKYEKTYWTILL